MAQEPLGARRGPAPPRAVGNPPAGPRLWGAVRAGDGRGRDPWLQARGAVPGRERSGPSQAGAEQAVPGRPRSHGR